MPGTGGGPPHADKHMEESGLRLLGLYAAVSADPDTAAQAKQTAQANVGWLKRRVEQVEFLSGCAVRWRVSVDFTVPREAPTINEGGGALRLVPIAVLPKGNLIAFDLRDEAGAALPMPTSEESSDLLAAGMIAYARSVLNADPPEELTEDLKLIIRTDPDDKEHKDAIKKFAVIAKWYYFSEQHNRVLRKLIATSPPHFWCALRLNFALIRADVAAGRALRKTMKIKDQKIRVAIERLMSNRYFLRLFAELEENFIMHVRVHEMPGTRRIIKFSREGSISFWKNTGIPVMALQVLGLRGWRLQVPVRPLGRSRHLEVAAASGVDVIKVKAEPIDPNDRAKPVDAPGLSPHAHIRIPPIFATSAYQAIITVRPSRRDWLTAALFTALLIATVIGICWQELGVLCDASRLSPGRGNSGSPAPASASASDETATAVTFFLALIGAFATWLVRPGEHPLASSLLGMVRFYLAADVAIVLTGAVYFLVHPPPVTPDNTLWKWLFWSALVLAVLTALPWLMVRRRPRWLSFAKRVLSQESRQEGDEQMRAPVRKAERGVVVIPGADGYLFTDDHDWNIKDQQGLLADLQTALTKLKAEPPAGEPTASQPGD
jgi:hypothetical protein